MRVEDFRAPDAPITRHRFGLAAAVKSGFTKRARMERT